MRYLIYCLSWLATVFSVSFYYKFFRDIFDHVYHQDMDAMMYGFTPDGMPEFNWKIKALLWLFCVVIMGILLCFIMEGLCKKHYKNRKSVSLPILLASQGVCVAVYVLAGVALNHHERLFFHEYFLGEILFDILPSFYPPREYIWLTALHALIFSAISLYFYLSERKKQHIIIEKEEEYRNSRLSED